MRLCRNERLAPMALAFVALSVLCSCAQPRSSARQVAREGPNIHAAVATCNVNRVRELLAADPELAFSTTSAGATSVLHESVNAKCDGTEVLAALLNAGAPSNVRDNHQATPLIIAAGRDLGMTELLLSHGADSNAEDSGGQTPLSSAIAAGRTGIVRQLVSAGAKADIFSAAATGDTVLLRELLRADPKLVNLQRDNRRPIDIACRYRQQSAARVLLEYMDSPPLSAMIIAGDESRVADYLDHRLISLQIPDARGRYPLNYAVQAGELQIARLLVERGADVNRGTPLEDAVRAGDLEAVQFLLDRHAKIPVYSRTGGVVRPSLYSVALMLKRPDIAELLKDSQ
jgi:ankyrin repeat protein